MNKTLVAKELLAVAKSLTAIQEPTPAQLQRLQGDLVHMAKEPVEVEWIDGEIYAYPATELGMYRIWDKYSAKIRKGYSTNLRKWYLIITS